MSPDNSKRVVYTILLGGYEELRSQPILRESNIRAVCLTDDENLVSDEWEIIQIKRRFAMDTIRSQRFLKICFNEHFSDYDEILYIDNTVLLKKLPEEILDEWLADADMATMPHSYRDSLLEEFDEVARLNYDDSTRVHEQLWDYSSSVPDVLEQKPLWTGLMARRNTLSVDAAMTTWWEHILRYSRRDQLSVLAALENSPVKLHRIHCDNFESEWHTWGVSGSRKVHLGKSSALSSGPLLVELLRTKHEVRAGHAMIDNLNSQVTQLSAAVEEKSNMLVSQAASNVQLEEINNSLSAEVSNLKNDRIFRPGVFAARVKGFAKRAKARLLP